MNLNQNALDTLATTVRVLSAQAVEKANSGHPGMPMGAADYATVLWSEFLRFNPDDPQWHGRDRFILSAGHGSMLLYSLLHLFGYDLSLDEIKRFRQWDSKTPGHPEFGMTAGVETTTGPLGQGFSNGVGIALSERMLHARFGDLFSSRVFGIVSDGDLMEGVTAEAASLAGHLELGNITYIYDDNSISIGGRTSITFTEDVPARFKAYGWHVTQIDGHDKLAIAEAIAEAVKVTDRPSLICARTIIGLGSPKKADTPDVHGAPLGKEELARTLQHLGWNHSEEFYIPEEVKAFCLSKVEQKREDYKQWQKEFDEFKKSNKELAATLNQYVNREVPESLKEKLINAFSTPSGDASRALSGKAIQIIAAEVPSFVGGSADLEPSTKTLINDSSDVQPDTMNGRNIRFGVREHAMGSIVNGFAYTRSWIPYGATFLVFSDYMRPAIRLAALSHLQSLFIFTHDSFWVGEDGPTHQPVEHLQSLRLIPNLYVYRPADGMEVAMSYWSALNRRNGPAALLFTRQGLFPVDRKGGPEEILRGAYRLTGSEDAELILVASGSEVGIALEASEKLKGRKVAVVSAPCLELFDEQPEAYKKSLFPATAKKVVIEAGSSIGWERYVGRDALLIGQNGYGASAPGEELAENFGFTTETVLKKINSWL